MCVTRRLVRHVPTGAAQGYVASFWAAGAVSFLIGLVAYFVADSLRFNVWAERIHDQYQRIASAMDALKHADAFADLLLLYGLRQRGWLDEETVYVDRDGVLNFWRDCIGRAKNRWSVVTYVAADETWRLAWKKVALAIQKERIMTGCEIERVFLVDSEEEWNSLNDVVAAQIDAGIRVSWVLASAVNAHVVAAEASERLGTYDVAIADDAWVYKTYLSKKRSLRGACASRDLAEVDLARTFIREVRALATPVSGAPAEHAPDVGKNAH